MDRVSKLVQKRSQEPWTWLDSLYFLTSNGKEFKKCLKILHGFTRKVIHERNSEFESSNFKTQKRIAFLDLLLKSKHEDKSLTFDDIQEEVDTFMFEGHDTSAAAMSWAIHLIGSHPDIQKKIHDELDEVLGINLN